MSLHFLTGSAFVRLSLFRASSPWRHVPASPKGGSPNTCNLYPTYVTQPIEKETHAVCLLSPAPRGLSVFLVPRRRRSAEATQAVWPRLYSEAPRCEHGGSRRPPAQPCKMGPQSTWFHDLRPSLTVWLS